ncbi:unnamed protein product [Sphacelaria rigidula]
MKQMWVGTEGIMGNQAGKMDNGMATLRAQNGKMVSSMGKREVLVDHYRKLGTPKLDTKFGTKFDTKFEKEINASAEANVQT